MIDEFMAHARRAGRRPSYLASLQRTLVRYEVETGPLDEASASLIDEHLDRRSLSSASRAVEVAHFGSFYRWAFRYDRLEGRNPMDQVVRPRVPKGMPNPILEAELARALQLADRPVRTILLLGAYAGLRACEVGGLRAEHVDADRIRVAGETAKGGKARVVPTHPSILAEVADHYPARGFLFPNRTGDGPASGHMISCRVHRFLRDNQVDGTMHRLRHRFATQLYRTSRDLLLVQQVLGHESPAQTAKYTLLVDDAGHRSVAMIA
jgi:integrase